MSRVRVHPGSFIRRNYVDELGLKQTELAAALEVNRGTLSRLLNEETDMSTMMAIRVSRVLGRSAQSWLNMQANHNLSKLEAEAKVRNWKPSLHLEGENLVVRAPRKKAVA